MRATETPEHRNQRVEKNLQLRRDEGRAADEEVEERVKRNIEEHGA